MNDIPMILFFDQVVNERWEVALGLTDGSGFQQAGTRKRGTL